MTNIMMLYITKDSTEITTKLHITLKPHITQDFRMDTMMLHIMREHSTDIMKRPHSTRMDHTTGMTVTMLPSHITTTQESDYTEITALLNILLDTSEFEMINYQK
jgi:hypothetical protein